MGWMDEDESLLALKEFLLLLGRPGSVARLGELLLTVSFPLLSVDERFALIGFIRVEIVFYLTFFSLTLM